MKILVAINYYLKEDSGLRSLSRFLLRRKDFLTYLHSLRTSPAVCTPDQLQGYIDTGGCDEEEIKERLRTLRIVLKASRNRTALLYLMQITSREVVLKRLRRRLNDSPGVKQPGRLLKEPPLPGRPPADAVAFTARMVRGLKEQTGEKDAARILTFNAHGIPAAAFQAEKEYFQKASNLTDYLSGAHARSVAVLRQHASSGELWFEQIITEPVVEYVASNQEILGGRLEGNRILLTKIPYDPDAWLRESDPGKKRYLACHCPMAREALGENPQEVDPLWCRCSAGFAARKFQTLFETGIEVEVLESVLAGDDRCRFALTVPERFLLNNL